MAEQIVKRITDYNTVTSPDLSSEILVVLPDTEADRMRLISLSDLIDLIAANHTHA